MYYRNDGFIPDYVQNQAVASGATFVGTPVILVGAMGVTVQATCSGGLAGNLIIEGSNYDGSTATYQASPTSIAVSANGSAVASFSLTDQLTGMHQMRCRFAASAAGTLNIALNLRRLAN